MCFDLSVIVAAGCCDLINPMWSRQTGGVGGSREQFPRTLCAAVCKIVSTLTFRPNIAQSPLLFVYGRVFVIIMSPHVVSAL
jgi:hypothetical protein